MKILEVKRNSDMNPIEQYLTKWAHRLQTDSLVESAKLIGLINSSFFPWVQGACHTKLKRTNQFKTRHAKIL